MTYQEANKRFIHRIPVKYRGAKYYIANMTTAYAILSKAKTSFRGTIRAKLSELR